MPEIYLDNSATTRPQPQVVKLAAEIMQHNFGNPSSMHDKGLAAEKAIAHARRQVAKAFSATEKEIIFTASGTEANNLAILGAARRNRNRGNHLITSKIEHPSVLHCFQRLEEEGFKVSYLDADRQGMVSSEELGDLLDSDTILISIMHVNNEIGSLQPLNEIGPIIKDKKPDALLHVDAVQSLCKLPITARRWQADLISGSAHKLHGPRGAGCLWVKEGVLLEPVIYGGGQEKGMRSGTENTAAIAGFGLAVELARSRLTENRTYLMELKLAFYRELQRLMPECEVNGPTPQSGAPQILNIAFPDVKAEVLLHSLEAEGVYVSAGSACHSRHPEPSHVLSAIGLKAASLEGSLRFSFSIQNSMEEIKKAAAITARLAGELRGYN